MARKTTTKKRSQKSSASQKKQRVRKSTSTVKANSSFNYKSFPFALLLLITLAALLINTLPMFQENTENLIGRAVDLNSITFSDLNLKEGDYILLSDGKSYEVDSITDSQVRLDGPLLENNWFGLDRNLGEYSSFSSATHVVRPSVKIIDPTGADTSGIFAADKLSDGISPTGSDVQLTIEESGVGTSKTITKEVSTAPTVPLDALKSTRETATIPELFVAETEDGFELTDSEGLLSHYKEGDQWYLADGSPIDDTIIIAKLEERTKVPTAAEKLAGDAKAAASAATSGLLVSTPTASDDRWDEGSDGTDNEYICPSADNCWWKKPDGEIVKVTEKEHVDAVRKVLTATTRVEDQGTPSDPRTEGLAFFESGRTTSTSDAVNEIPESVHKSATAGGYSEIAAKQDGTTTRVLYSNGEGEYREVSYDKDQTAFRLKETFTTPESTVKDADGKEVVVPQTSRTTYKFYNVEGEYLMDYDDSQLTKDGKQVVNFKNSKFYKDTRFVVDPSDIDSETGACNKDRACFKAVNTKNEETGGELKVTYGQSSMDAGYVARINEHRENGVTSIEEEYIVEQRGKGLGKVTTSRKYEAQEKGGDIKEEALYQKTNGARQKVFVYETVGESETKHRVFYETTVQGTLFQNKRSVSQGNDCVGNTECVVSAVYEDGSGDTVIQSFDDKNNNGRIDDGEKTTDPLVVTEDRFIGTRFTAEVDCGGDSGCEAAISVARSRRRAQVMLGATSTQQATGQILGAFTSTTLQPVSSLLCGGGVCFPETVQGLDQWFAGSVLSTDYYESLVCAAHYERLQAEGVAFSDNGQNVRGVGTANADVSGPQEVLCDLDQEENDGCPENHYCQNDLCYNEETDEVAQGYLYYITWGVTAPQDEAQTVYINENGFGVSYNIVLSGDKYAGNHPDNKDQNSEIRLYSYEGNDIDPLVLYSGESDGQKLVHMSLNENLYKYICIDWATAPRTVPNPVTRQLEGDPNFVPDICTEIKMEQIDAVNLLGGLVDSRPSSVTGGSSETQQSVTTETIQTNADW